MIVAIDPGVTTGVAKWTAEQFDGPFWSGQFDEHEFYRWFDDIANTIEHCQIESFIINAATVRKTVVYDSLYLIGYMRYMAWLHDFTIAFTKPADVMGSFPDAALKRAGMFNRGKGHANDAARHLAWYCVQKRLLSGSIFLP
jgi:hypothetical protein